MNSKTAVALMELVNAVNGSHGKEAEVREVFRCSHRTLQQNLMREVVLPILKELDAAYQSGAYDGRNQASVDLAHRLLSNVEEFDLFLPYI